MKQFLLICLSVTISVFSLAQVSINTTNAPAHNSAMLDITSTAKGLLIPRMTTAQRTAIASPARGLMVMDTVSNSLWYFNGISWGELSATTANLWSKTGNHIYNTNTGNVGIGVASPNASALLHGEVTNSATKGFLFNGAGAANASVPDLGTGSRMFYYPGKAVFRAGFVEGNQWDNDNAGPWSTALGNSNIASAIGAMGFGWKTTASGTFATSMGMTTVAAGELSTATGYYTSAKGFNSFTMGRSTNAEGAYSLAAGYYTITKGAASTTVGLFNDSLLLNGETTVSDFSPLLLVGNGDADTARRNAFAVAKAGRVFIDPSSKNNGVSNLNSLCFGSYFGTGEAIASKRTEGGHRYGLDFYTGGQNRLHIANGGNVGIGTTTPYARLHVADSSVVFAAAGDITSSPGNVAIEGAGRRMMWYAGKAAFRAGYVNGVEWDKDSIGYYSAAIGSNTIAKCSGSFAAGLSSVATGEASVALGSQAKATGTASSALGYGCTGSGFRSVAIGNLAVASGYSSTAMGAAGIAS